jgi:hypothetical protein
MQANGMSLRIIAEWAEEQKQILRLTTPKLKSVWGW